MGVNLKKLKPSRKSIITSLALLSVGGVFFASDRIIAQIYESQRSTIESILSKPLGHPLRLGIYKGLRPFGIAIGKTRILQGLEDSSSATFSGFNLKIAPLSSLIKWRPVLIITPFQSKLNLEQNEEGSFWALGSNEGKPPRLDLHLQLLEPVDLYLKDSNLKIKTIGNIQIMFHEKKASGFLNFKFPNKGGFGVSGKGNWNKLDFNSRIRVKDFNLALIDKITKYKTDGIINGNFQIGLEKKGAFCSGELNLANFTLTSEEIANSISTENTSLNCKDNILNLSKSQWKFGPWLASLKARIPIEDKNKMNLSVKAILGLEDANESNLDVNAQIPISIKEKNILLGDLNANLKLNPFPLNVIGKLINAPMAGTIFAEGILQGPLKSLNTNLSLGIINPQFAGVRLQEEWRGTFIGNTENSKLQMSSIGAAVPSSLKTSFNRNFLIKNLRIERLGGYIILDESKENFLWTANDFRLDRVEIAIPPEKSFKRIFGKLNGKGYLSLSPINFNGDISLIYPRLIGLRLKEASFNSKYNGKIFNVDGQLLPPDGGQIEITAKGERNGFLDIKATANDITAKWLTRTALEIPKISIKPPEVKGKAEDLGSFIVKSFGESLDIGFYSLMKSKASLIRNRQDTPTREIINPNDIKGRLNASVKVSGPDISNLDLDMNLTGRIWPKGKKDLIDFEGKPFVAKLRGPLQGGTGQFSLLNVPFSLLSLLIPLPSTLSGMIGLKGNYRRNNGFPLVNAELVLEDATLLNDKIVLDRGDLDISRSKLDVDILVRSISSVEPIKLKGQIPLKNNIDFNFRVESHDDGLRLLEGLTESVVSWKTGRADFRFLITGTLENPDANGFLVIKNGELDVLDKQVEDLETSILFDFNRLEIKNINALIDSTGSINGSGVISLFRPEINEDNLLNINMRKVPLELPIADVELDSNLILKGALLKPIIGGDLTIKKGSISLGKRSPKNSSNNNETVSRESLFKNRRKYVEESWDMSNPLILFVQDEEAPASKILSRSFPKKYSAISFKDFRLILGPDLNITSPPNIFTRRPLAVFNASGVLNLNGSLDKTLTPRGVVRLTKGRVNLFTTTFALDRSEPNVAVFTPSTGLIPYVDVTMRSRVSDTVRDASNSLPNDFARNGTGSFGIGGSRFVNVELAASGPADRLSENFELRSTPPMPRSQLLGLIGGNSLTSLLGGSETGVIADVLNRSLITPVLGNLSGAFSEKLQVSLYPTYVRSSKTSNEGGESESASTDELGGDLSPQKAWVTEIGIDLSKKFNFSLQATPNREDIPPQGTLTFQVNPNLGVLGSLDKDGKWQSQFELFFRF
tara:strand:- start:820 stop:4791 length:3972 start_codon:yes stop_codon:yes gene_type:complete